MGLDFFEENNQTITMDSACYYPVHKHFWLWNRENWGKWWEMYSFNRTHMAK